jgi:hypothetical protein
MNYFIASVRMKYILPLLWTNNHLILVGSILKTAEGHLQYFLFYFFKEARPDGSF